MEHGAQHTEPELHDILDLITSRRSITKYLTKPVEWELISRICDAARHAPSCGNLQNWRFVVVRDPAKRKALAEAAVQQYWMMAAPVHIVVCAEPEKAERYYGVRGERLYTVQNCAAAVENILLEAHALGLGACWIGAFDEESVKRTIRAEEFVRPQALITIGYAAEVPPKPPKYPLNAMVYLDRWRNVLSKEAEYMFDYATIIDRNVQKGKAILKELGSKAKEFVQEKILDKKAEPKPHVDENAEKGYYTVPSDAEHEPDK